MQLIQQKKRAFRCTTGAGIIAASFIACSHTVAQPTQDAAGRDDPSFVDISLPPMRALVERYNDDRALLDRKYPVDMSPRRRSRLASFYATWRTRLHRVDFDALDRAGKLDYIMLESELAREIATLDHEHSRFQDMMPLLPFAHTIVALEDARRDMKPVDPHQCAATLADLVTHIEQVRNEWTTCIRQHRSTSQEEPASSSPIKPTVANRAASMNNSLRRTLSDWFAYYDGYDPLFTWWVSEPYRELDAALADYTRFLREQLVNAGEKEDDDPIIGDPIGRDALLDALRFEMIPYTPEQLVEIARHEYDWCLREMKRASNELGFGDDWHAALEHVKTLHVEPGGQPALIRELALEAIDFIESRDLLTVPELASEGWRMQMMSPARQKMSPYFLGGESIIVSYPTDAMAHEDKLMSMRGNNRYFSRAVVHHELIPGHHLQGFMTDRFSTYRRRFGTPFWTEGWALYWEMLLWDLDFATTPEQRIGMLFWRMHRCARIVFSLSFHLEQMNAQECVDYLVKHVGHERNNAEAEVRRSVSGAYGPLYQAAYMLGGLQFRALHRELVQSGRMTSREFHDRILRLGPIPVEMVRAALIESVPLSREFTSTWRFYGAIE